MTVDDASSCSDSAPATRSENPQPEAEPAPDRLDRLVVDYGAQARPLRRVVALLTEGPWTVGNLVRASGVARRTVEEVLGCLDGDLARDPAAPADTVTIPAPLVDAYRARIGYDQLRRTQLADPLTGRLAAHPELVDTMTGLVAAAPPSRADLDHVPATGETAARRALWMDSTYDLTGSHLLCVGDHDLTSLAACLLVPGLAATVVDLDERLLEFIDTQARRRGLAVRCLFADLRFGLPAATEERADLVFTDPPYTPEGVSLFLRRGLAGLRDTERGRLLLAYGHSDLHPALGWKVQRAVGDLHLTIEAIMADFNGYDGAEAVGAASDLYVCRPTAATWRQLSAMASGQEGRATIYTRGRQAVESAATGPSPEAAQELLAAAATDLDGGRLVFVGDGTPDFSPAGPTHVRLVTVLRGGLPRSVCGRGRVQVAADLSADPGPWLARTLLAVNADRIAILVPADHTDLVSADSFAALSSLVAPKWRLRRRRLPRERLALVEATPVDVAGLDEGTAMARWLLDRPHGKIGNVWREGLIRLATDHAAGPLTKKDARAMVEAAVGEDDLLATTLMDLPRHRITRIVATAALPTGSLGPPAPSVHPGGPQARSGSGSG